MPDEDVGPSMQMGLLENARHSLQRGFQQWSLGSTQKDGPTLKEALVWVHHGVELSLKQLLVQQNHFLVFADVDRAVDQLLKLRKKAGLRAATALELFDSQARVTSVGFRNLVDRACVMLDIQELSPDKPLRLYVDELTAYRNRVMHFSVRIPIAEVESLISDLMEPLLELLERHVLDKQFVTVYIPEIRQHANSLSVHAHDLYAKGEARVQDLTRRLSGKVVDGKLLGSTGTVTFPEFETVEATQRGRSGPDIWAGSPSEDWIVEVKMRMTDSASARHALSKLRNHADNHHGRATETMPPQCWLVVLGELSSRLLAQLRDSRVFFSEAKDIAALEELAR